MRTRIAAFAILSAICLLGGVYMFMWAVNNFLAGLTLEALALSVVLVVMGVGFAAAAKNTRRRLR